MSWDGGKEQNKQKLFMAYNQDPQRAAGREEKEKPESGIRAVKTRQMPAAKPTG